VLAVVLLGVASLARAQGGAITIRGAAALDGRGSSIADATIVVRDGLIFIFGRGAEGAPTYELRGLTLLP
jgi:hypothetical protein